MHLNIGSHGTFINNKNDNIHKNEVQDIRRSDKY